MPKRTVFVIIICCFAFSFTKPGSLKKGEVKWISMSELQVKIRKEPRPVLMDLYTNWCYWCKVMDKKTYSNIQVAEYINTHYYAVKLNAETQDTVVWNGKRFIYDNKNKVNEFSIYATRGQLAFPNTLIFPDFTKAPAAIPGFLEPKQIEGILKYFGSGVYENESFDVYLKNFKSTW